MRKRKVDPKKLLELEKKFIKFIDDSIRLELEAERMWKHITRYLKDYGKEESDFIIEFDDYMSFPNIKVVQYATYLEDEPILKPNPVCPSPREYIEIFKTAQQLDILYYENDRRFILAPSILRKLGNTNNTYNFIPVIKANDTKNSYVKALNDVANKYMPAIIIVNNKHFLIHVGSESSIRNLINYRQALSMAFNEQFKKKVGRPATREFYQREFNYVFPFYRAGSTVDKALEKVIEHFVNEFGYEISHDSMKRIYYQDYKKNEPKGIQLKLKRKMSKKG